MLTRKQTSIMKSLVNAMLSLGIVLFILQSVLAIAATVSAPFAQVSHLTIRGLTVTGQLAFMPLLALCMHNALWVYALAKAKMLLPTFQLSDIMTKKFATLIKKTGGLLVVVELFSSYLNTLHLPNGSFFLRIDYGVYLIIAGFVCDYVRRNMKKDSSQA